MRARYYDPSTSRFINRDPIWTSDQINLYTYVANNSMKYVDRGGEEKVSLAIKETISAYRRIVIWWMRWLNNYTLYFNSADLTDEERVLYWNFSFLDLVKLSLNKDAVYDNEKYYKIINSTRSNSNYARLLMRYGNNEGLMHQKLWWNSWNNTYADSLRHSYFNALNTNSFWVDTAKQIWDAHEMFDWNIWRTSIIDLYNNSIWRSIWSQ